MIIPIRPLVLKEMQQKLQEVRLKYKDIDSLGNQNIQLYKEKGWIDCVCNFLQDSYL